MSTVWSWNNKPKGVGGGNKTLARPANKTGYSYSIKGGPPPARPPREFLESHSYHTAPPMREPQQVPRNRDSHANRGSAFRPASSVYSQPSPVNNNFPPNVSGSNYRYGTTAPDEISPPSSPEPSYTTSHGARANRGRSRDVSPMDDSRVTMPSNVRASPDPQSRTNIPMMRRARRKQSDAALREAHSKERLGSQRQTPQKGDARWDTMTGEPTNSEKGKPSQVKPAEFARGFGASPPAAASQQRSPTAAITAFGDRVRRMAQGPKADKKQPDSSNSPQAATDPASAAFLSSRPAWRGASGWTAQVEPVRDNPEAAPLKIPRKSSKRVTSPVSATGPNPNLGSAAGVGVAGGQAAPAKTPGSETAARSAPRETLRRVVPSSQMAPAGAPVSSKQTPGPDGLGNSRAPVPGSFDGADAPTVAARALLPSVAGGNTMDPQTTNTVRRKPPPAHANHAHQESLSSVYSQDPQPPPPPPHGANPVSTQPPDSWTQPASRFSVTTFATSAAATPRESFDTWDHDRPPMPTPPQQYRESPPKTKQESVMDRQRPKLLSSGAYADDDQPSSGAPIIISFKDTAYTTSPSSKPSAAARQRQAAATGAHDSYQSMVTRARTTTERPVSSASNASSINKMLPPAPPEASAGEARDRVGMLNAQLQSLGNRRINLNRSIKQMTELMPQDNVLDSADVIHKREMEKRKVEVLREELADVQRQEYELGLKLHRAYKRMDRDADWENSALWVRRVTG